MDIKCPHCEKEFPVVASDKLLDEQTISFVIHHAEGKLLQAKTVWGTIREFEKLMKYGAEDLGAKARTYIRSIKHSNSKLTVQFVVMSDGPNVVPSIAEGLKQLENQIREGNKE